MRVITRAGVGCWALSLLFACDRELWVGSLPDDSVVDMGGRGGASAGQGGASLIPDPEETLPATLAFSSTFEAGDLSEWGLSGTSSTTSGGEIITQDLLAHGGSFAAEIVTHETGAHVVLGAEGDWSEVLIRFWIRIDTLYETQNWPILHIDAERDAGLEQLWDLGLDGSDGESYALFLWEMPAIAENQEAGRAATSTARLSLGAWSQIQVHVLPAADDSGFIRVFLDGLEVLSLTDRAAGTGDPLRLGFGSFAYDLEPRPASFVIDDVEILVP